MRVTFKTVIDYTFLDFFLIGVIVFFARGAENNDTIDIVNGLYNELQEENNPRIIQQALPSKSRLDFRVLSARQLEF